MLLGAVELLAVRLAARRVAMQAAWLVMLLALQGPLHLHHRFSDPAPAHHEVVELHLDTPPPLLLLERLTLLGLQDLL